jgi:hypothetical protein
MSKELGRIAEVREALAYYEAKLLEDERVAELVPGFRAYRQEHLTMMANHYRDTLDRLEVELAVKETFNGDSEDENG